MSILAEAAIDEAEGSVGEMEPSETPGRSRRDSGSKSPLQAFLSLIDQCLVSGTNFATTVIIGRMCTKHELGIYSLAFSVLLLVRGIQYQIVSAPYMIFWSRRPLAERGAYLGSAVIHQLVLTVLVVLGLAGHVALLWRGAGGPPGLLPVMVVLLLGVPFLLVREFIRTLALSHLRMAEAIGIDAAVAAIQLGFLLGLAWFDLLTIQAVYAVMGLACLAAFAGWRAFQKPVVEFDRWRWLADWRGNWRFGKWALASHLVGGSTPYLMPWIVAIAHGEADTGVLAAATTLVGVANTFVLGLGNFLTPRSALAFSEGGSRALVRVLVRFALIFGVTLGAFCGVIAVVGNSLGTLVYGNRYQGIGPIITLLAVTLVANSLRMTAGTGLWSLERPRSNFVADFVTLAVTLLVSIVLVGPLGVLGAAIGIVSGSIAGAVVGAAILVRALDSCTGSTPSVEGNPA